MATRIPVVSVVGKSDSGKTTLMEGLIRALAARGWRVATVKHHIHDFDIDIPGKDSWRHARAGATVTMISAPDKFGVVRRVDRERTIDELVEAAGPDVDILLTEGFKRAGDVRIEVSRAARSDELICEPDQLFALVTDVAYDVGQVPVFGLDDADGLASLIERTFLTATPPVAASPAVSAAPTGSGA
jgi:molybdopterin-guanine dinucleotide biosynthesis adapter protein